MGIQGFDIISLVTGGVLENITVNVDYTSSTSTVFATSTAVVYDLSSHDPLVTSLGEYYCGQNTMNVLLGAIYYDSTTIAPLRWNNKIDNVMVFDTDLADDEILTLCNMTEKDHYFEVREFKIGEPQVEDNR